MGSVLMGLWDSGGLQGCRCWYCELELCWSCMRECRLQQQVLLRAD